VSGRKARKVVSIAQGMMQRADALREKTGWATKSELADAYESMALIAIQIDAILALPLKTFTRKAKRP
jgi:hypothetical protein